MKLLRVLFVLSVVTSLATLWIIKTFISNYGPRTFLSIIWTRNLTFIEPPHNKPRIGLRLFLQELDEDEVPFDHCIFFLETKEMFLSERAACSVESAALSMPDRTVFVLMTKDTVECGHDTMRALLRLPNVKFRKVDPEVLLEQVGLSDWFDNQLPKYPPYMYVHLSDTMRAALLYLYGGIYLDTDVIVQHSLDELPEALGMENERTVNIAVMKLDRRHPFLALWLNNTSTRFDPLWWGSVGVFMVGDLLLQSCQEDNATMLYMYQDECQTDIPQIYPSNYFYSIPYQSHQVLFDQGAAGDTMELVQGSYTVHTWHKMNSDLKIDKSVDCAFNRLAQMHCPATYSSSDTFYM